VVVAIDPAVSTREGSDATGIIVAGKDERGHGYVLEDLSGRYQPADWARIAVEAYHRHSADRIVAEVNQGGDLVESTIRMVDANVPFTAVHASRGKYVRAEPIAALFEQNRVHLVGNFPLLEDQLTQFAPDLDRGKAGSPDRADSMIWAMHDLIVGREPYAGLIDFYESEARAVALRSDNGARHEPCGSKISTQNGRQIETDELLPWSEIALSQATVVLFCAPHSNFQTGSGTRYAANARGEIEVNNPGDAKDLLRMGCQEQR
jgi:hypothetical protein